MKKLLILLMIGLSHAGMFTNSGAQSEITESYANVRTRTGYQFLTMEVKGQEAPTANPLTWYGKAIGGYSTIDFYGMEVSTGSIPTTISAQPAYEDGTAISIAAQIITSGTDMTDFKSGWYIFTLPAASVTRNVSFNFLIAD